METLANSTLRREMTGIQKILLVLLFNPIILKISTIKLQQCISEIYFLFAVMVMLNPNWMPTFSERCAGWGERAIRRFRRKQ